MALISGSRACPRPVARRRGGSFPGLADWHVREECYAQALAGLIDAHHRQPLAAHWGSGTTSSSDAQFFHAGARGEVGGLVNLHYGQDPGVKFYTHLSDQFGPFHTKVIAATANGAYPWYPY